MKSGRRKGVSPGHPTKHDEKMCGRRNVENMEKVVHSRFVYDVHVHVSTCTCICIMYMYICTMYIHHVHLCV